MLKHLGLNFFHELVLLFFHLVGFPGLWFRHFIGGRYGTGSDIEDTEKKHGEGQGRNPEHIAVQEGVPARQTGAEGGQHRYHEEDNERHHGIQMLFSRIGIVVVYVAAEKQEPS